MSTSLSVDDSVGVLNLVFDLKDTTEKDVVLVSDKEELNIRRVFSISLGISSLT